tara:strand:+ start:906 stop:1640 length:735 start_codon:yes stop_codon:yes gene_type:complete
MSNYSKTTDFAAKDALSTGNANKIVKGTEIDDEFSAIQTAVNSKANTNSPALTGSPTAPTASSSTDNTQLATTAYVTAAVTAALAVAETARQALFPVGTIYTQAGVATNPATLLGFGTWEEYGAGKAIIGVDASNTLFDTLGETGGSADSPSVSSTTGSTAITIDQMPAHNHPNTTVDSSGGALNYLPTSGNPNFTWGGGGLGGMYGLDSQGGGQGHTHTITNSSVTNANYQPYITVYMWKRTA